MSTQISRLILAVVVSSFISSGLTFAALRNRDTPGQVAQVRIFPVEWYISDVINEGDEYTVEMKDEWSLLPKRVRLNKIQDLLRIHTANWKLHNDGSAWKKVSVSIFDRHGECLGYANYRNEGNLYIVD